MMKILRKQIREISIYRDGTLLSEDEFDSRYALYTGGWGGGHLYNRNWVSACIPYDEELDYEYVDEIYPFDESNQLPTALFRIL